MTTWRELLPIYGWRPISGCPGRYVLTGGPSDVGPGELLGDLTPCMAIPLPGARDPVAILPLAEGGLISYHRADGRWIHTLCDAEGFARKRALLV